MERKHNYELWVFLITAFIGGSFGAYAILRCGMFGSAQTVNLITSIIALLGRNPQEFVTRVVIAMFYALGVVIGVLIPRYTKLDVKKVSLWITAISTIVLGLIPQSYVGEYVLIPIFLSMSLQWNAFPGACGYLATSIFLTNNFRQTVIGATNYICTREREHLKNFLFHFGVVICYFLGCGVSYVCVSLCGFHSITFVLIPLIAIYIILGQEAKAEKNLLNI